jgi:hypothetical protein
VIGWITAGVLVISAGIGAARGGQLKIFRSGGGRCSQYIPVARLISTIADFWQLSLGPPRKRMRTIRARSHVEPAAWATIPMPRPHPAGAGHRNWVGLQSELWLQQMQSSEGERPEDYWILRCA